MTIPWREIDAELQAVFTRGAGNLAHHIAMAIQPGARFDAVTCLLGGPEAKAIVMLGDQHNVLCAGVANRLHPLIGIKMCRVEDRRIGCAVSPFPIEKCISGEVDDDAKLQILPFDLLGRRLNVREVLCASRKSAKKESEAE